MLNTTSSNRLNILRYGYTMTLHKDQDPGWWRRGMSTRAIKIVVIVSVALIVGGFIIMALNGIPLF